MKGKSGTLLASAVILLVGGTAAGRAPGVHLVTSIQTLSHTPQGIRYAVSVRPVGGPAHAATLVLSTRSPAVWTATAPGCLSSADRTTLACDLGDLHPQQARTLHVTARPGEAGAVQVPVIARAGAANAPTVTVSLGAVHPAALRLASVVRRGVIHRRGKSFQLRGAGLDNGSGVEPPGRAGAVPVRTVREWAEPSPSFSPSADVSPAPEASPMPAISPVPTVSAAPQASVAASPDPSSWAGLPTASASPGIQVPWPANAVPPRRVRPSDRHSARRAPAVPASASASAQPTPPKETNPPAPDIPPLPVTPAGPTAPAAPAAPPGGPPSGGLAGGPVLPLPTVSAPPPRTAPQAGSHDGVSELSTLSPAGAMQAGRASWATLIAIAVVTEAGLLWLVAGLTVMRRRRMGADARRPRLRWPWPFIARLLPRNGNSL